MEEKNKKDSKSEQKHFESIQQERPTTVMCPWHQLPLQVESENYYDENEKKTKFRWFAICNCRVENNDHTGTRVWEQT